ncbi:recombinase family protein [Sphingobium sp. DN12]|uniref:recombinase family protein n=1 Tax=Sphingobium sp. DN12 TaxID=3378073 RepID=UPI003DA457FB
MDVRTTIQKLAAEGVRVHCLALGRVDLTSPAGKMTMAVIAAVAEFERDLLIERTQSGLARAKAAGTLLGRPQCLTDDQQSDITPSAGHAYPWVLWQSNTTSAGQLFSERKSERQHDAFSVLLKTRAGLSQVEIAARDIAEARARQPPMERGRPRCDDQSRRKLGRVDKRGSQPGEVLIQARLLERQACSPGRRQPALSQWNAARPASWMPLARHA